MPRHKVSLQRASAVDDTRVLRNLTTVVKVCRFRFDVDAVVNHPQKLENHGKQSSIASSVWMKGIKPFAMALVGVLFTTHSNVFFAWLLAIFLKTPIILYYSFYRQATWVTSSFLSLILHPRAPMSFLSTGMP